MDDTGFDSALGATREEQEARDGETRGVGSRRAEVNDVGRPSLENPQELGGAVRLGEEGGVRDTGLQEGIQPEVEGQKTD